MHRWVDHTGELELRIEAPSEPQVFTEALTAFGNLMRERSNEHGAGTTVRREVSASAVDGPALLAEWLSELVFLVEAEGFVPARVERLELRGVELRATVSGRRGSPPHLVKAVTYHRLELREERGSWYATVVLDV